MKLFQKTYWTLFVLALAIGCTSHLRRPATLQEAYPKWAYDAGPNPNHSMGQELIDLYARIPYYPGLSMELMGSQKFRPVYGPVPWRMIQEPNSVKILFIGQDATHIAEAAGRPATAGFGGRAQDLAKYFGVSSSAAFINTYAFTIRGQYGGFQTPQLVTTSDGSQKMEFRSFVDNGLWLMTQDPASPLAQWRNDLIDWIIRNNRDSLKLIVLFGGAARDAAGSFVESHGGHVGALYSEERLAQVQIPEFSMEFAGGNNELPVPLTAEGEDLYGVILKQRRPKYSNPATVQAVQNELRNNLSHWKDQMVFSQGGPYHNGILHAAQVGGYNIDRALEINGQRTLSIKGLKLSDGSAIENEILVAQLPHPTALSRMTPEKAAEAVAKDLAAFDPYVQKGWYIQPDSGFENSFAAKKPYRYARAGMGPEYYDFGAPASRMVAVSSASRKTQNIIIFGTRDKARFDEALLQKMTEALPSDLPDSSELWTMRARGSKTRNIFDPGPGEKYARLMKIHLPEDLIEAHPINKDYGHYRGTFKNPRVLILADPHGYDDLITARALTGSRGQYLHGLMTDMGVGDQYLVLKTAPFGQDSAEDWKNILKQTESYREALIQAVLADHAPELILTDGPDAALEMRRIVGDTAPCPVIAIDRSRSNSPESGILKAASEIQKIATFRNLKAQGKMKDIPRSHLSFYARLWEGTSGDRVITSSDEKYQGRAFAEVAPAWAYEQKFQMSSEEQKALKKLNEKLDKAGLRRGHESVPEFLQRLKGSSPHSKRKTEEMVFSAVA